MRTLFTWTLLAGALLLGVVGPLVLLALWLLATLGYLATVRAFLPVFVVLWFFVPIVAVWVLPRLIHDVSVRILKTIRTGLVVAACTLSFGILAVGWDVFDRMLPVATNWYQSLARLLLEWIVVGFVVGLPMITTAAAGLTIERADSLRGD